MGNTKTQKGIQKYKREHKIQKRQNKIKGNTKEGKNKQGIQK